MADEKVKKIIEKRRPEVKCKSEIDFIKEIRREMVNAHLEYDKRLSAIWEKLNKYIKDNEVVKQ